MEIETRVSYDGGAYASYSHATGTAAQAHMADILNTYRKLSGDPRKPVEVLADGKGGFRVIINGHEWAWSLHWGSPEYEVHW